MVVYDGGVLAMIYLVPITPMMNIAHAPDWQRYIYASLMIVYAVIMMMAAINWHRKSK